MEEIEISGTCNDHETKQEMQTEIWSGRDPLRDSDIDRKIWNVTKCVNLGSQMEKDTVGWTCSLHVVDRYLRLQDSDEDNLEVFVHLC